MSSSMELEGMDQLFTRLRELGDLGDGAKRVENKALRKAAEPVKSRMIENVNRSDKNQTHIQDDIKISVRTKDGIKGVLIGPSKKTSWRAKFLEFGTSKMSARPFVEKSLDESEDDAIEVLKNEISKGLGL